MYSPDSLQQFFFPGVHQLQQQLAEKRIGPCKPGACIVGWIVALKGFVHESCVGVGRCQGVQATPYFLVIGAGHGLQDDTHGPYVAESDVRPAYSCTCLALEEIRVVGAEHEAACVLVDGIVQRHVTDIGEGEQGWYVGIVHEQCVAISVHFVGVYLSVARMGYDGMLPQCCLYLCGQRIATVGKCPRMVDVPQEPG